MGKAKEKERGSERSGKKEKRRSWDGHEKHKSKTRSARWEQGEDSRRWKEKEENGAAPGAHGFSFSFGSSLCAPHRGRSGGERFHNAVAAKRTSRRYEINKRCGTTLVLCARLFSYCTFFFLYVSSFCFAQGKHEGDGSLCEVAVGDAHSSLYFSNFSLSCSCLRGRNSMEKRSDGEIYKWSEGHQPSLKLECLLMGAKSIPSRVLAWIWSPFWDAMQEFYCSRVN